MKPTLSPKELADAIGVSESSLKRWADDGRIHVHRTAGGHRRITIAEAIRFVRDSGSPVLRPDILGFPDLGTVEASADGAAQADERLYALLREGQAAEARGMILSMYLSGQSVAEIGDGAVARAMGRIGALWIDDPMGIFYEHRASTICMEAIIQLGMLLAPPPEHAPVAVGAAPQHDTSSLPTLLAATVLKEERFRAINLGPQTPLETLWHAVEHHNASLTWLSITHRDRDETLAGKVQQLLDQLSSRSVRLILGGSAVGTLSLPKHDGLYIARTMGEMVAFARGLRLGAPHGGATQG